MSPDIRLPAGGVSGVMHRPRGLASLLATVAGVSLGLATSAAAADHAVTGQSLPYVFVPAALSIAVGDTVTWTLHGDPHTVTSGTPGAADDRFADHPAADGLLIDGSTFMTSFPSAGVFPYFCEVHFETMTGTITVGGAATPSPTSKPTAAPTPKATTAPTPGPTATATAAPTVPATAGPSPDLGPSPTSPTIPSAPPSEAPVPSPTPGRPGYGGGYGSPGDAPGGGSGAGDPLVPLAVVGLAALAVAAYVVRRRGAR